MLFPSSGTKQATHSAVSTFMDSFSSYRNKLDLHTVTLHLDAESTLGDKFDLTVPIKSAILNSSSAESRRSVVLGNKNPLEK